MPVSESMISALIDLNRADDEGLVAQLTSQLRNLIATGRLGKGRALPSSRRLASDLGVSRNTVTYAFEQLAAEGYLEASHGRRPMVTVDGGERIEDAGAVASRVRPGKPRLSPWASKPQADRLADVLSGAAKTLASGARRFQGVSERGLGALPAPQRRARGQARARTGQPDAPARGAGALSGDQQGRPRHGGSDPDPAERAGRADLDCGRAHHARRRRLGRGSRLSRCRGRLPRVRRARDRDEVGRAGHAADAGNGRAEIHLHDAIAPAPDRPADVARAPHRISWPEQARQDLDRGGRLRRRIPL